MFEGVPLLLELFNSLSDADPQVPMKKVVINILCTIPHASDKARQKIQENGGINIFINLLKTSLIPSKVIDTIVKFIEGDQDEKLRQTLIKNIDILIQCFRNNTVPMFPTLIRLMPREFYSSPQFCKTLAELMQAKEQTSLNLRHLLQILLIFLE